MRLTRTAAVGAIVAVLAALSASVTSTAGAVTSAPPARVAGVIAGFSDSSSAAFSWDAPESLSSPISKYVVRVSADGGVTWSAPRDVTAEPSYTLDGLSTAVARLVQVAAVSAGGQGEWSAPLMVTTKGTRSMRVAVLTAGGQPVTGGAITWEMVPRTAWSSVTYGLTADGLIEFPSARAGTVKVTLVNGQLPDGTWVSGRWMASLGFASTELRLPYVTPAVRRVNVTLPGGLPVANVRVDVAGLEESTGVARFVFAAPAGSTSGYTDSAGVFTAVGFASGTVQATVTYDDGVIGQEKVINLYGVDTDVQLDYAPFVTADVSTARGAVGAGVDVSLTARAGGNVSSVQEVSRAAGLAGVRVSLVPPAGAPTGSCGARLSGVTNFRGKVALRVCATKSGLVRVRTAGALPAGSFTLLVRGLPSLPVRSVTAKSPSAGRLSMSWAPPFFTGGASVLRYRIEAATPGQTTVVREVPVKSISTPLSKTVTGLLNARRYTVRIYAITKYGRSDAVVKTVSVA
jgi:hypothetical protein